MLIFERIVHLFPLFFGIGFLAPLIDQSLSAAGVTSIAGVSTLVVGLVVGSVWGGIAVYRGRWF